VNIPYTYLAVLLVFTLLIGVVIGDRLAAGIVNESEDGIGRAGGCAGLASGRLHECLHRYGHLRSAPKRTARSGASPWQDPKGYGGDTTCELPEDYREGE
jgi:hypothetical protein